MILAARPLYHNNKQKLVCKNESDQRRAALNSLSVSMKLKMKRMMRDKIGMKVRERSLETEDPGWH